MSKLLPPYQFRVCYSDTDAAGFVHHARYLEIFERARTEYLHQLNLNPAKLVQEFSILLPIREITMHFHKPGCLDDLLFIEQIIEQRGRTQVAVKQTAKRSNPLNINTEPELIASAVLHIVCVDSNSLKPKALPDWLFPVSASE
jgi:acyl-CoA thioester hydrolase